MFCKHQSGSGSGLKFTLALTGAVLINLLIMVLIPWLFRGSGGRRELPHLSPEPIYVAAPKPEQKPPSSPMELEPPPEIKLPEPLSELARPLPSLPAIKSEIKMDKVRLDTRIDSEISLHPQIKTLSRPVTPGLKPEFYRMGEVDREPVSLARMEPVYPFRARRRGIEGSVKVRFFVTRTGQVDGLEIIKAEPAGFFENTVRQTVSKWRFQPGMVAGGKVKTLVETTIVFKLGR
jgi:protein TonB